MSKAALKFPRARSEMGKDSGNLLKAWGTQAFAPETDEKAGCSDNYPAIYIESEKEFDDSLRNVEEHGLHAMFYFTAEWIYPCNQVAPIIEKICEEYDNVIDKATIHFYQNGVKSAELVGADIRKLTTIAENLYK